MTLHLDDKVAGAVLGAAIGDALGHPTEFPSAESIRQRFPPDGVEGYELWWEREGERFAPYTDDTQMAEVVLRSLVKGRRTGANFESVMADMAAGFVEWRTNPQGGHRTPGNACLEGAAQLAAGLHWSTTGGERAGGCGSVMRAYPFDVVFVNNLAQAEEWAVQHSAMTHRDPIALAACAAMAIGVGMTLAGEPVDVVLEAMVTVAARYSLPTAEMMRAAIADARAGSDPLSILKRLEGWALWLSHMRQSRPRPSLLLAIITMFGRQFLKALMPTGTATASPRSPAPLWARASVLLLSLMNGCETSNGRRTC